MRMQKGHGTVEITWHKRGSRSEKSASCHRSAPQPRGKAKYGPLFREESGT